MSAIFSEDYVNESLLRHDHLIRSEIFSGERLEQHAESLALSHKVSRNPSQPRLLEKRLKKNDQTLQDIYRKIGKAIGEASELPPAAEWLVDNYFVLEEQIRDIRNDLPPKYYAQLPKLAEGHLAGYPRVYGIAWAYIAHTDSYFSPALLERFIRAYQRKCLLTIGELWAVSITLRIALVENIQRASTLIIADREARARADLLADWLLKLVETQSASLEETEALDHINKAELTSAFAVQLIHRLRDQGPYVVPLIERLDARLRLQGTSAEEIVRIEHQNQGALTVTVRNIITSMRSLSTFDWVEFFESISLVDEKLRAHSNFGAMDLPTRNLYRRAIERLARRSPWDELEVAGYALQAARATKSPEAAATIEVHEQSREQDPGYYLIDKGAATLEQTLGYKPTWREKMNRAPAGVTFFAYMISNLFFVTLILEAVIAGTVTYHHSLGTLIALSCAALFPAWEAAVTLTNRFVVASFAPSILPGLALRAGIPEHLRTMVVIPTLLSDPQDIKEQVELLEVHYLGNADGDIRFALLTDWKDADSEKVPGDEHQLVAAQNAIAELNRRHPLTEGAPRFFLFHRRRLWNPQEGKWMGWERKRGKLHEFNRLLRGAADTSFLTNPAEGYEAPPQNVRYVVTLDADTRLPRGVVKRLVGKMAHPLNHASFDTQAGYVTEGYGILQPRVASSLPDDQSNSFFQRVFYSASGIDPYAFAISDVYQDLFEEGSFTGKGIYDVDVFERAVTGKIPENTVLSHDLLEGIFARAGLASDVEVVEEFPSRYDVASTRQHRWARGDWQLLAWIFGKFSGTVPTVGRWKMLDNLRRTFTAPFAFLALLIGWSFPLRLALLWTTVIIAALSMPLLIAFCEGLVLRRSASRSSHALTVAKDTLRTAQQITLMVVFLPHQAWLMMDGVVRTLWRLTVSRKNLLEWTTAAEAGAARARSIADFYKYMADSLVIVVFATLGLATANAVTWPVAFPFLALWVLAPVIAQIASRTGTGRVRKKLLDESEQKRYRLIARATWRFFDRFVTAGENYLPPDNFQEDPVPVVAHRTSPTNIGIYMLAVIAAHDLGWITVGESLERLRQTFDTLKKMEHFRGHLYNWYDTVTLHPLNPRYISSVDSGNFAGYLIVVAETCRQRGASPILNPQWALGLQDTVDLTLRALDQVPDEAPSTTHRLIEENLAQLGAVIARAVTAPPSLQNAYAALNEIEALSETVHDLTATFHAEMGDKPNTADADVMRWGHELHSAVTACQRDLARYAPWLSLVFGPLHIENKLPSPLFDLLAGPIPTLRGLASLCTETATLTADHVLDSADPAAREWSSQLLQNLREARHRAQSDEAEAHSLAAEAIEMYNEMDFSFLLDTQRQLLSIGYRVEDNALDPSSYDLLASEARLASIVAIAKGDIPARNWFRLGRTVTAIDYRPALVSWSGSMFEYLMPTLVMREPEESLIGQTNRMIVRRQIDYGIERGVPWGVSESAYNARDFEFTYQYSSFGVPGLGLKRGLSENIVIAPYATGLAAMIDPHAALDNYEEMEKIGGRGAYGWYEALDFTSKRLPADKELAVVRCYMAHHQGMSLIAILNVLQKGVMRDRFHAAPVIQATELLLQELPPRNVALAHPRSEEVESVAHIREIIPPNPRHFATPHTPTPQTHLLSNGDYAVMVTNAGSGYSQWRNMAVTRWREDAARDPWGAYIYIRDVQNGDLWSAAYQPTCAEADHYAVDFFEDHAEFTRRDGTLVTTMNVIASSEDPGEVRRLTIHNQGSETRELELTSYAELVLTHQNADIAHPVFTKMFVQTEFIPEAAALLATRRPRSAEEKPIWAVHLISVGNEIVGNIQFETDRARFLGRGRTARSPQAVDGRPLGDEAGTVLDPIFSLRCRVRIEPGATLRVAFWTLIAASRQEALDLVDKYRATSAYYRAAARAWTQAQLHYQHLGMTPEEAHLFQRLANHVLYTDNALRPGGEILKRGSGAQSLLWSAGISGDLPIVLVRVDVGSDLKTLRQLIRAHTYWAFKRLEVDLVILNEQPITYLETLQNEIDLLVRTSQAMPRAVGQGVKGGIFTLRADHISHEARALLPVIARAVITGHRGSLVEHLAPLMRTGAVALPSRHRRPALPSPSVPKIRPALEFFNGVGGFAEQGRQYVTILEPGQSTPAPWINVIANPGFGFHVSAEGAGYTWAINSREYKLTPWSNDPVSDEPGEAIYLRDIENGAVWSPTASPIRKEGVTYIARHGFGYSQFTTTCYGIESILTHYVPLKDSIKITRLKLRNTTSSWRRLSISSYTEWVLAPARTASSSFLITEMDKENGAMQVRNPWNNEFGTRTAFASMERPDSWTADRKEFIGRNGALTHPAALHENVSLSCKTGATLDPCTALQRVIGLGPAQEAEITLMLGEAENSVAATHLLQTYQRADLDAVLDEVKQHWENSLGHIQIRTPDRAMDIMQNGWLLYQTIACRIWARSAFYQSSGAYGYRDQLQDTMAMVFHHPAWTRQHLLRAASRQFPEGDVQHWWLPSTVNAGRGVRTRFSDDPLWLAYVTAYYVKITGDTEVLDEPVPFLEGTPLLDEEHEAFFLPQYAQQHATLFEHCLLAIDCRLKTGAHGISLFGGGDWNDGMNRVGIKGQGESIWLAWFLLTVMQDFTKLAEHRAPTTVALWRIHATDLKAALEQNGWDGEWYRRGFYDDGTPLGSASSAECRIDSLAQSWAVISGAADGERQIRAMKAVEQYLLKPDEGIALLFTPPFDRSPQDPGYIKAYPPGLRENGGQYTHAALWSIMAFNKLGEGDKGTALYSMLNPIHHSNSRASSYRYKVEPYVVAADIYANPQHMGRGGWTWYTGSAGWMYRVGLESILGLDLQGDRMRLNPCIPKNWPGFELIYRYKSATYSIRVDNKAAVNRGVAAVRLDGKQIPAASPIPLADDNAAHTVLVTMG